MDKFTAALKNIKKKNRRSSNSGSRNHSDSSSRLSSVGNVSREASVKMMPPRRGREGNFYIARHDTGFHDVGGPRTRSTMFAAAERASGSNGEASLQPLAYIPHAVPEGFTLMSVEHEQVYDSIRSGLAPNIQRCLSTLWWETFHSQGSGFSLGIIVECTTTMHLE